MQISGFYNRLRGIARVFLHSQHWSLNGECPWLVYGWLQVWNSNLKTTKSNV